MRKEINEQFAICAMKAAEKHLVNAEGKQIKTMYPKVAEMGPMILRSGLLPTVANYNDQSGQEAELKRRVNAAVFQTLSDFINCNGIPDLWQPDERLRELVGIKTDLLGLANGLTSISDYALVCEYVLQAITYLKLTLNTFPEEQRNREA